MKMMTLKPWCRLGFMSTFEKSYGLLIVGTWSQKEKYCVCAGSSVEGYDNDVDGE